MKSKEQYLNEYESLLRQTDAIKQKLNELNTRKGQLQAQTNNAEQTLLPGVLSQINSLTTQLEQLKSQSLTYQNELNGLTNNDNSLKQRISNLEKQYQATAGELHQYNQAFTDIMVILNGFSAKEGLNLNQSQVLAKILPPEELVRTDVLKKAIVMNHIEEFDKTLAKITEINFQDVEGKTLLMHAASNGFYYGVEKLLALGADVNLLDKNGANLLIHAAKVPHLDYMEKIAKLVDNVNCQDTDGNNALHYTILSARHRLFTEEFTKYDLSGGSDTVYLDIRQIDGLVLNRPKNISIGGERADGYTASQAKIQIIIDKLLDCGINFNAQNSSGQTPFYLACASKLKYLAGYMISKGADPNLPDSAGTYPIHLATSAGFTEIVKLLTEYCDVNIKASSVHSVTPLYLACQDGNLEIVKWLLDHGANPNLVRADNNLSPICVAMQKKQLTVVNELLNRTNVDLNITDKDGYSPMHYSVLLEDANVIQLLKNKGLDINIINNEGMTPFYIACLYIKAQAMNLLKNLGADINILNKAGFHSVHAAAYNGHTEIIEKLIAMGVDVNTKSTSGYTPLQYYCELKGARLDTIKYLESKGAKFDCTGGEYNYTLVHSAVTGNNKEILEYLLDKGINVNSSLKIGNTPVMLACELNNLEMVKFLVSKGADVHKTADKGVTAMHYACGYGSVELIRYLLELGATIEQKNALDGDGVHEAFYTSNLPVIEFLDKLGFNFNYKSSVEYKSPLIYLLENKSVPIEKKIAVLEKYIKKLDLSIQDNEGHDVVYYANTYCPEAINLVLGQYNAEQPLLGVSSNSDA